VSAKLTHLEVHLQFASLVLVVPKSILPSTRVAVVRDILASIEQSLELSRITCRGSKKYRCGFCSRCNEVVDTALPHTTYERVRSNARTYLLYPACSSARVAHIDASTAAMHVLQ
jgi:phage baseplate assembly protein W